MTPFGERVRELRKARGMTLSAMAGELGLSPAYLSALEHGRRGRPAPGLVMQICGCLGLIWDETAELKALAKHSHPRVTVDTAGLSPQATALANRLARAIRHLPDPTIQAMLALLPKEKG